MANEFSSEGMGKLIAAINDPTQWDMLADKASEIGSPPLLDASILSESPGISERLFNGTGAAAGMLEYMQNQQGGQGSPQASAPQGKVGSQIRGAIPFKPLQNNLELTSMPTLADLLGGR